MHQVLIPLIMAAMFTCASAAIASAQSSIHYDFEDGRVRGDPTSMRVPPKILTEGGNSSMRITGSASDKESIPPSYPHRNRSTVRFTSSPMITSANMRMTYRADLRFSRGRRNHGSVFELFQTESGSSESYGEVNGTGPVTRFFYSSDPGWHAPNDHAFNGTCSNNERACVYTDLGYLAPETWHTFMIKAVWSHDPQVGRIEVYVDGRLRRTFGWDVNLGPRSDHVPLMKVGLYGDYATGTVDVDNVWVSGGSSGEEGPPPPATPPPEDPAAAPLPPPRNFRVVLR